MRKSVRKLIAVSNETKVATPVVVNGRKHYMDLRPLHNEYLLATYRDGSLGMYLCTPDGCIEKDDSSVFEGVSNAL